MARLAAAVVVGVAAFVLSGYNPAVGLEAFSLTYGLTGFLDPTKRVFGTKLSDLKATQSAYGVPWPSGIEGAPRLAGNIIWASEKRAIANTQSQGGKGGPKVQGTTYTYEMDVMWGLADQQCAGIRRVWVNGALAWTVGDDADAPSLVVSGGIFVDIANKLIEGGANKYWRAIRFYGGAQDQLPDPTYEAAVGVGNAPAYRGRSTVVVEGLNLGDSGQMPVLTFELVSDSLASHGVIDQSSNVPTVHYVGLGAPAFSIDGYETIQADERSDSDGLFRSFMVWTIPALGPAVLKADNIPTPYPLGGSFVGSSDETCLLSTKGNPGGGGAATLFTMIFADGSYIQLPPDGMGSTQIRFSKRDDKILVCNSFTDMMLRTYERSGGALLQRSAPMAKFIGTCALSPSYAFAFSADGVEVYQLDPDDLSLVQTIPFGLDDTGYQCTLVADEDGGLYVMGASSVTHPGAIWKWDGGVSTHWTLVTDHHAELRANPANNDQAAVVNGAFFSQAFHTEIAPPTIFFRYLVTRLSIVTPPLDQVVRRALLATGQYVDGDFDVSALSGDIVRATVTSQVGNIRQRLEPLMAAYFFDFAEGPTLRAVKRGGSSVATIPLADMGAGTDGSAEPLPLTNLNDIEVAAQVTITYANVSNDFQDGAETGDRLITSSTAVVATQIPIGLLPAEAKRIADVNTMDLAVSLLQAGPISVTRKYAALETGDVVMLEGREGEFRCRITKLTFSGGVITMELVLDDATVINSTAGTDSDYPASTLLKLVGATQLALLDIPLLRDVDNTPGFYAGFSGEAGWPGAELDVSLDGTSYTKNLVVTDSTVIGVTTSALPNFTSGNVFDERSTLTVQVGDMTLSSFSKSSIRAGAADAYLVGSEIVQAHTATLLTASPNVYRLSGFLRGLRGTEWAKIGHGASERFVVLHPAGTGMRRVGEQQSDLNVSKYWEAITFGQSRTGVSAQAFVDTGISLKPFAPVDLQGRGFAGGDFVFSWHRRSRLSSRYLQQVATPLGETTESYDVELRDSAHALKRSATVSSPSYSVSGLADSLAFDAIPTFGLRTIAGELVGISGSVNQNQGLVRLDTAGNTLGTTPGGPTGIADVIHQWDHIGDTLYAVTMDTAVASDGVSTYPTDSKLQTFNRASLSAAGTAIGETSVPGDWRGLACDGTYVWIALYASNKIRKLDPTTLATIAEFSMPGGPKSLRYQAGKLYIACVTSREAVRFDIAGSAEDWRVSTPCFASYTAVGTLIPTGSIVFVLGLTVDVRSASTGALLRAYDSVSGCVPRMIGSGNDGAAQFGSNLVVLSQLTNSSPYTYNFFDVSTGVMNNIVAAPAGVVAGVSVDGTQLLAQGSAPPPAYLLRTRGFVLAPPGFSGWTLTVYQNSAIVGRGYPASKVLP